MKFSALVVAFLTAVSCGAAASIPEPKGFHSAAELADGLYIVTVDESGNYTTAFKPYNEVIKRSALPSANEPAHHLERRRSGCGPGSASREDNVNAQNCLKSYFGDQVSLRKNQWTYCIRGNALAFVCPYTDVLKYKANLEGTFNWVDSTCGLNIMGYNQVSGGIGDMTAGRCTRTDNFCTKGFHAGN